MRNDNELIRDVISTWQHATAAGDLPQLQRSLKTTWQRGRVVIRRDVHA